MQAGKRFADREAFSFPLGYYFEICVRGRLSMTLKSVSLSSAMFLLCFSSMAGAQDASSTTQAAQPAPQSSPAVQPQAQAAEPPAKLILKEGTDVKLKFAQDLSSKTATDDDPVNLVLDEDLKVGDVTVVKAGAKALGTVTHAKKAGMMGKGGELNLRLEYLIAGDSRMRLRGTKGKEGEGKVGAAVALTVLFGPIGLIKHGKNVEVKQGSPLLAYVDQDFTLPAAK
jgi:glucose/arabinose dehydrogenase